MYPVFIVGNKIAFSTSTFTEKGNILRLGFKSFVTPWGFFIPLEPRSFAIKEYLEFGWRNINHGFKTIEGMMISHNGIVKHLELRRFGGDDSKTPIEMMDNDKNANRYKSYDKCAHVLVETVIPYCEGFRGSFSESEPVGKMGDVVLEMKENIEDVIDAYRKGSVVPPSEYIIFDIRDAANWLNENNFQRPIPWSWEVNKVKRPKIEK